MTRPPPALSEEFGDPIRAAVRQELSRLGVTHVDAAEVDGLTLGVCADLSAGRSRGTRTRCGSLDVGHDAGPGPFGTYVGQFADPLPEGGAAEAAAVQAPAGHDDESVLVTLGRLAGVRSELRLLQEALGRISRPGQQEILFEVRMQAHQGDPSPAVTIARARALRPDCVRQTCKRVINKVSNLAATDPYFAPLAELPLLRKAS